MSTAPRDYPSFIEEVFLTPIRSVLAIDDEFPTLDKFLNSSPEELAALNRDANWNRLQQLTKFCREQTKELLLDVHDGQHDPATELPLKTLRQCDWVVLDFQLNGPTGDGARCCEILGRLADSEHFNLVTVYTQKLLPAVFQEIIENFSEPLDGQTLAMDQLDENISEWEDRDPEITDKLIDSLGGSTYFRLKEMGFWKNPCMQTGGILTSFTKLWKEAPAEIKNIYKKHEFLGRVARTYEHKKGFSDYKGPTISDRSRFESNHKWLLVGNMFISLVEKDEAPENLRRRLLNCLTEWNPPPNRLALAKLRALSDAMGFTADTAVMEDKDVQAYWFESLLQSDDWQRREHIESLVDRQTELLIDQLRSQVILYTEQAIAGIQDQNIAQAIKDYFGPEADPKKGKAGHNTVISNRNVSGSNLIPGHIFEIPTVEGPDGRELWICLSPACDLVPFRPNVRSLKKRLSDWLPLTAVKLFPVEPGIGTKRATEGHIVFLRENGRYCQYSIYKGGDPSKNPEWEEFFAGSGGVLAASSGTQFQIARLSSIPKKAEAYNQRLRQAMSSRARLNQKKSKHSGRSVVAHLSVGTLQPFEYLTAKLIGQLRAEYAANLTQKLTAHLSRIGLEYC